jgi:uncharacterized membrane protein
VSALFIEIPIVMIFLSRVLKYSINRWVNIIAAILTLVFVVGGIERAPFFLFFTSIETLVILLIIWTAFKWKAPILERVALISHTTTKLSS